MRMENPKMPIMIEMPRGDIHPVRFGLYWKNHDEIESEPFDSIYFTVKKNFTYHQYKFQKSLANGSIISIGDGSYQFMIMPEDTNGLDFGTYDFDIQVSRGLALKQTFYGKLKLTAESTHHCNEQVQVSGPLEITVSEEDMLELELQGPVVIVEKGTDDYNELKNKPSINGVELQGNKSFEDFGMDGGFVEITPGEVGTLVAEAESELHR